MGRIMYCTLVLLGTLALSVTANATHQTIAGTVTGIEVDAPSFGAVQTIAFQLSNHPTATGCKGATNGWFSFSPTTVTDAQTRTNLLATLFAARISGINVLIVYDDAGANCDPFGYPAPYLILMQ